MSGRTSRLVLLAATSLGLSCARTALQPDCPRGMTLEGDGCVCVADEGCPAGYACESSLCVCRDTACCPRGYGYSTESQTCVCRDTACCPRDHRWDPVASRCACDNESCCPQGYSFDPSAGGCRCASDQCCPTGFRYDPAKQQCVCAADGCCPLDHRYDAVTSSCVCAKSSCCPLGYSYDDVIRACVCSGNACCPPGFRFDVPTNRCVCTSDASCGTGGAHNRCDQATGTCRCRDDRGCAQPPAVAVAQYCNSLGFCQPATCTSNRDCPSSSTNPTFCDITTGTCIRTATCTLDDHCPFAQLCNASTATCAAGCRNDDGCPIRQACVAGQCQAFCRENQLCPQVGQFCNPSLGACSTRPGRVDCLDCTLGGQSTCGDPDVATCLVFIAEGQNDALFCGMACQQASDCPAGYECDAVIFSCDSDLECPQVSGTTITCEPFDVENEGLRHYCAGPGGDPHEYYRRCGPSSGFCPASVSP